VKLASLPDVDAFGNPILILPQINGKVRVDPDVFASAPNTLEFTADDILEFRAPADVASPPHVSLAFLAVGFDVQDAILQAGNATATDELLSLRASIKDISLLNSQLSGGDVEIAGSTETVVQSLPPQIITVDNTQITAQRNIVLGLNTVPSTIVLKNSTVLQALVGSITVQSKGQPITIDGSTLTAATDILIDGIENGGIVNLKNATMSADTIRARGFSTAADALIIEGGSFTARNFIKFYAESASKLLFKGNVTLDTPLATFAGQTVEVEAGGTVNNLKAGGQINVHSDTHHYNSTGNVSPGFGTITSPGGVNSLPHGSRPSF
jgi:hypothetical protein